MLVGWIPSSCGAIELDDVLHDLLSEKLGQCHEQQTEWSILTDSLDDSYVLTKHVLQ